jgi:ATP/maltotriose-dependent transcriptional regulator MalT
VAALGEAQLRAGRPEAAAASVARALELARRHSEPGFEAHALRVAAAVAAHEGRHHDARARYRDALTRAEALGMAPLAGRCHLGLAQLPGEADDVGQHRRRAAETFATLGMAFWQEQVGTLPRS